MSEKETKKHFKLYRFICFYMNYVLRCIVSVFMYFWVSVFYNINGYRRILKDSVKLDIYLSSILHLRTIKILVNVLLISNISIEIFAIIFL